MLRSVIRHLFPPPRKQSKLPLLAREYSSDNRPKADKVDPRKIAMLKTYNLARTDEDAIRILNKYPGEDIRKIVKRLRRKRKKGNRWMQAWNRLKKMW